MYYFSGDVQLQNLHFLTKNYRVLRLRIMYYFSGDVKLQNLHFHTKKKKKNDLKLRFRVLQNIQTAKFIFPY